MTGRHGPRRVATLTARTALAVVLGVGALAGCSEQQKQEYGDATVVKPSAAVPQSSDPAASDGPEGSSSPLGTCLFTAAEVTAAFEVIGFTAREGVLTEGASVGLCTYDRADDADVDPAQLVVRRHPYGGTAVGEAPGGSGGEGALTFEALDPMYASMAACTTARTEGEAECQAGTENAYVLTEAHAVWFFLPEGAFEVKPSASEPGDDAMTEALKGLVTPATGLTPLAG